MLFLNGGVPNVTDPDNSDVCFLAQRLLNDAERSQCFGTAGYR